MKTHIFTREANPFILDIARSGVPVNSRVWKDLEIPWIVALAICTVALLVPAAYNRFPLLFPDTDAYLDVAYGHAWTLDRSAFYGLFLKPFLLPSSNSLGLWLATGAQAAVVAAILLATVRRMLPDASQTLCATVIVATALLSSLPWHTSQLMPDAFTGPLVLLAWLTASRDADLPGSPSLWLCTGLLTLLHYTHLPLLTITFLTTIGLAAIHGIALKRVRRRLVAASITISAVIAAQIFANGLLFHRWTVSPMGGWFLFARVHQDGLAGDWLAGHCGRDAPEALCKIRASLPRDSQTLLWSASSPIYDKVEGEVASPAFWTWTDMLSRAAIGSISEEPATFIKYSAVAAGRQFVSFTLLDDHCPGGCQPVALFRFRPTVEAPVKSSRQLAGGIHAEPLRWVTLFAATVALVAMTPLIIIAHRRRDKRAMSLLLTVFVSLLANAAITGALSDVQPRYQSRVVWLAVFSGLIVLVRWFHLKESAAGPRRTNAEQILELI